MIFDTHAHYDDSAFDKDRCELIASLPEKGVGRVINMGASLRGCRAGAELAGKYSHIYFGAGIHPDDCGPMDETWIDEIREFSKNPKCVAIGEIGLDYHGFDIYDDKPSKEVQQKWFLRQLVLAAETGKTADIHSRNACEDTLSFMRKARYELGVEKAVIHCFSYSKETAEEYLDMGYWLGFGGTVTYEGQKKLTKVLEITPPEKILLETDCPYLAPVPHRGERNDSTNLIYVRDRIAEIKGMSAEELEEITWRNAFRAFNLPE